MNEPIPSAGETTNIGSIPVYQQAPVTVTSDRPLTSEDIDTIKNLPAGTALLISTRGAMSGSRYLLDEDIVTAGRDPKEDIILDDSTVSRTHAEFRRENGEFYIYDKGSLNGTYVNRHFRLSAVSASPSLFPAASAPSTSSSASPFRLSTASRWRWVSSTPPFPTPRRPSPRSSSVSVHTHTNPSVSSQPWALLL